MPASDLQVGDASRGLARIVASILLPSVPRAAIWWQYLPSEVTTHRALPTAKKI